MKSQHISRRAEDKNQSGREITVARSEQWSVGMEKEIQDRTRKIVPAAKPKLTINTRFAHKPMLFW
jgi:hypothetical protein